jgi:hypothetical protein
MNDPHPTVGKQLDAYSADAIARFFEDGGQITKLREVISVSEQEILDYLGSCGIAVKRLPAGSGAYSCKGKRYTLASLSKLANHYRIRQQLSPFVVEAPRRDRKR